MRFKLFNVSGTNKWRARFDPDNDGLNYITLGPDSPNMFYLNGLPMGDTVVAGGALGGNYNAYDHHLNLKWATNSNDSGWQLWDTNMLYEDLIAGWHWEWRRNYEYEVKVDPI